MSTSIARGAVSSCSNPLLDLWTLDSTFALADAFSVKFQVFDISDDTKFATPVQVFPISVGTKQTVDLTLTCPTSGAGKISTGRAVATWTVGGSEPLGRHRIVWFVQQTSTSAEVQYTEDFDVLVAGLSMKGASYALLSDLRAEGITSTTLSDIRGLSLIRVASTLVERYTRRFFEPRFRTVTIDGSAGPTLFLQDPVIVLSSAAIDDQTVDSSDSYQVFNRHITEGLTNPDDRDNPRVTFVRIVRNLQRLNVYDRPWNNKALWWPGARNVSLTGLFGYTDPDDSCQVGVTPELVKRVTMMIVVRELGLLSNTDDRFDAQNNYRTKDMRTRDQSISFGPVGSSTATMVRGEFTGDPSIDSILEMYIAPPFIGSP